MEQLLLEDMEMEIQLNCGKINYLNRNQIFLNKLNKYFLIRINLIKLLSYFKITISKISIK